MSPGSEGCHIESFLHYLNAGGEDYFPPNENPVIEAGSVAQCTSISIADDDILEQAEVLRFSLHLPPDSNEQVQLSREGDPVQITITDNDGKSIPDNLFSLWKLHISISALCCLTNAVVTATMVQTSYTVLEGDGVLAVCAILTGRTERPVELSLSTESASAIGKFL